MDTFEMLKRLLSQNEFELLLPDQTGAKEKNTDKTCLLYTSDAADE